MRRTCTLFLFGFVAAITACRGSDGTRPSAGVVKIGIVSGNNQSAKAGASQYGAPLVGQVVRQSNTAWTRLQRPSTRLLDLIVPLAYAQSTTLNGSPVPGQVVEFNSIGENGLTAYIKFAVTDTAGKATFLLKTGTRAGEQLGIVIAVVDGQPTVVDTARATVLPGPVAFFGWVGAKGDTTVHVGDVLNFATYPVRARDQYGNIVPTYVFTYQRVNADPALTDPAPIAGTLVTVRSGDTGVRFWADGVGESTITLRIAP